MTGPARIATGGETLTFSFDGVAYQARPGDTLAAARDARHVYLDGGEVGPALGAARLAQLAVDGGTPADVCVAPRTAHVIEPQAALRDRLAPKYAAFRDAYSRIRSL